MEPVTMMNVAEVAKEVSDAARDIQKVGNVADEVKNVAESEGKDRPDGLTPLDAQSLFVEEMPSSMEGQSKLGGFDELTPLDAQSLFVEEMPSSIEGLQESGLTYEQKEEIKAETGWSDRIVDSIRTMDEAQVYKDAGLQEGEINGKPALLQPRIDGSAYNAPQWPDYSNKDLAEEGYPPRDESGRPYELHHIGQNPDSPLAELTYEQHRGDGNFKTLHTFEESLIDRIQFNQERKEYWMARSQTM